MQLLRNRRDLIVGLPGDLKDSVDKILALRFARSGSDQLLSRLGTLLVVAALVRPVTTRPIDTTALFLEHCVVEFKKDIAATGDSEKGMLIGEWTLENRNPKAHGAIYDIA